MEIFFLHTSEEEERLAKEEEERKEKEEEDRKEKAKEEEARLATEKVDGDGNDKNEVEKSMHTETAVDEKEVEVKEHKNESAIADDNLDDKKELLSKSKEEEKTNDANKEGKKAKVKDIYFKKFTFSEC